MKRRQRRIDRAPNYALSKTQIRELERGKRLNICIPTDLDWDAETDPEQYARERLELPFGTELVLAKVDHALVDPATKSTGEVTSVLGQIVNDDSPRWTIDIRCVVVVIHNTARDVEGDIRQQWPGKIVT